MPTTHTRATLPAQTTYKAQPAATIPALSGLASLTSWSHRWPNIPLGPSLAQPYGFAAGPRGPPRRPCGDRHCPPGRRRPPCAVAGPTMADVPWPQQRYDFPALGQLTDGSGVTVAVIDSGVSPGAPQLAGALRPGADQLAAGGDGREDCAAHGTAVASIIAARPTPGTGLRGLAPGVNIVPVRVSERIADSGAASAPGAGDVADLAAGIRAAVAHRPRPAVINLSISTTKDNAGLRAGHRSRDRRRHRRHRRRRERLRTRQPGHLPGRYPGVVGVGGIGPDSIRVPSSQVGSYVDIVAPGDRSSGRCPAAGRPATKAPASPPRSSPPPPRSSGPAGPGWPRPTWSAVSWPPPTRPRARGPRRTTATACSTPCGR